MSKKIWPVTSVESGKPLYDDETGKFLGWGFEVKFKGREFYFPFGVKIVGGPLRPIGVNWCKVTYAFTPSCLRLHSAYRRMLDFQEKMRQEKKQYEKVA